MSRICYMVIATLPSTTVADEYVSWLEDGHVDQVVKRGAHSAMIVRLDSDSAGKPRVMTHYVFATREVFDHYVAQHAPALRADGLKRFPPERGISFARSVGEIV